VSTLFPKALADRMRAVEGRLDAWAARRLSPEEYAEAVALDRTVKRHFGRIALTFALATGVVAVVVMGIRPQTGFGAALLLSAVGLLYLTCAIISAWYGYRKWTGRPAWKVFAILVALVMGGGAIGFAVGSFGDGRTLAEISTEKATRGAAITFLLGMSFAALLVGVSRMRLRDAAQTAARHRAEAERERLARRGVQAELKLLQAQVEPHFLFNTLANVRYLVQSGSPDALAMLDHLITYLRTALPEIRSEASTLGREGELARAYLEIMRIRMGGALEFTIDVPPDLAPVAFPSLMLMTLVENAIKHGVAPIGRGRVDVRARRERDHLRITVDDDGRGIVQPAGRGVGLANVRARLRALHGDAAYIAIEDREGQGTRAVIQVPA
jgi:signal transduction histidine kinase